MALRSTDIFVGSVAYFDDELLLSEEDIDAGDSEVDRPGPFVCVQTKGASSVWIAMTGESRPERLFVDPKWRMYGSDKWRQDGQYINDGLCTCLGPNEAFVRAGSKEAPFNKYRRPRISDEGIAAILLEIEKQGGPLL